jgi:hypothetical protein
VRLTNPNSLEEQEPHKIRDACLSLRLDRYYGVQHSQEWRDGFLWIEFDALWNEGQTRVMTNMLARGVEREDGLSCSGIGEGARRGVGIGGVAAEGGRRMNKPSPGKLHPT